MRSPATRYFAGRARATALLLVALTAPAPAAAQTPGPAEVFDSLWVAFDRGYALLGDKDVPWTAVGRMYRPRALRTETDAELFEVLSEMLVTLHDNHVKLTGWDRFLPNAGTLRDARLDDFSLDVVRERYLTTPAEERVDGLVTFGWLGDSVGYVHVAAMDDEPATAAAMDEVVATFAGARGVVVDVRGNLGGDDPVAQAIASRFADRPRPYMTTRFKSGPGRHDFADPVRWSVTPPETGAYVGPIALLVQEYTMSAAEGFVLAMRTLPHVVVLGGPTAGALGDVVNDVLPNGWHYRSVRARTLDAEGRSWEGIGIPPDVHARNRPEEVERGTDRVLDLALQLVRAGGLAETDPVGEAPEVRLPLADSVAAWLDDRGLEAALDRFHASRADTARWYLAEDPEYGRDLVGLAERLLEAGGTVAAVAVLEAAAGTHPDSYRPWHRLSRAYERVGHTEAAAAARRRGLELNPRLYPEDRQAAIEMRGLLPLAHRFAEDAFRLGVEPAIDRLRSARAADPDRAHVDPLVLLRVGHQFRESRQLESARRVFEFHIEELPDDARGHLGLAETFRMMEREEDALAAYREVLRIDPENRRAKRMVTTLDDERSGATTGEGHPDRPPPHLGGWTGTLHDGSTRTDLRLCLREMGSSDGRSTVDLPGLGYYDLEAHAAAEGDAMAVTFLLRGVTGRISFEVDGETARGRWDGPGAPGEVRLWRSRECGPRYRARPFGFRNGDHRLAGTLLLPSDSAGPYPAVVWTHGSGAIDRSDPTYRGLAVALTELGVASLIYDKRGVGESTGDYRSASMRELAADAVAGVERLAEHPEIIAGQIGVGGISQGGWISPAAASLSPSVGFVVGLSAPGISPAEQNLFNQHNKLLDAGVPEDVVRHVDDVLRGIYRFYRTGEGLRVVEADLRLLADAPWFDAAHELAYWRRRGLEPLPEAYMEDLFFDPGEVWARVRVPSILIWGEDDDLVPAWKSRGVIDRALDEAGNARRNLLVLPRTGHSLRLPAQRPWSWGPLHPGYRIVADFILTLQE